MDRNPAMIVDMLGREEYRDGLIPLAYSFSFSNGEMLCVSQREDGIALIRIERDGVCVFDFAELLPQGFRFTTPHYVLEEEKREPRIYAPVFLGTWCTSQSRKMVHVGDWTHPEHLFNLLHEIGHAPQDITYHQALVKGNREKRGDKEYSTSEAMQEIQRRILEWESWEERDAWASALRYVIRIRQRTGVNLVREIFGVPGSLHDYICQALASHKEKAYKIQWKDGGLFLDRLFDKNPHAPSTS